MPKHLFLQSLCQLCGVLCIPTLETLRDRWETFAAMSKFSKLKGSIEKGLAKLKKYYRFLDQNNVAFISLGEQFIFWLYI